MVALEGNSSYHYARPRLLLTYLAVVVKPTHHYDCQSGGDIDIAPLMLSPSILANLCCTEVPEAPLDWGLWRQLTTGP